MSDKRIPEQSSDNMSPEAHPATPIVESFKGRGKWLTDEEVAAESKPAGEWTVEEVRVVVGNGWRVRCVYGTGAQAIVEAHNAALADDDKRRFFAYWRENGDLKQKLADEQERVRIADAAMNAANQAMMKAVRVADDLDKQLAAAVDLLEGIGNQTVEPRCAAIAQNWLAKTKEAQ